MTTTGAPCAAPAVLAKAPVLAVAPVTAVTPVLAVPAVPAVFAATPAPAPALAVAPVPAQLDVSVLAAATLPDLRSAAGIFATTGATIAADIAAAIAAITRVSATAADYRAMDDATLLELNRLASVERQLVESHALVIAGEIAYRSAPALGHSGLAQRNGYRTPEELVRVSTRSTARDAFAAVRVGLLARDAQLEPAPTRPWLGAVTRALTEGSMPIASADAIQSGLGEPTESLPDSLLAEATEQLVIEAATLDPDRLFRRARQLRDELDELGVADREQVRRDRRSLRFIRQPDGMGRLTWLLDPESAAVAAELYDRATSPRRGGPRFQGEDETTAERILGDARTTAQLASDVFLELLCQGSAGDDTQLLGSGAPSVRVLVTAAALRSGIGHGWLEGQSDPVSMETVQRLGCAGIVMPLLFDSGQPLDVGRSERLFTYRQRITLAARDGGCRIAGCDRPPSWTEAHHVKHWVRDGGATDVADGILLCRHHHQMLHNNHWEIRRRGAQYWLVPPPDIDPDQTPIFMPAKSGVMRDLERERAS
ncbi:DUF222 domain-containing protein [Salinibacterium sp.]|uniref:HNH endonuclease signature motif containing protein n=1 Tax=Salinibacterium sp. TaxID=1915057 RepID=UPI00286A8874|nr:DUF222 domain-containing protein [Salinibacterium sp.]